MSDIIRLRRGTATDWTGANPTLALGEPGTETDTQKWKTGDGVTAWNSLPYMLGSSGGGGGGGSSIMFCMKADASSTDAYAHAHFGGSGYDEVWITYDLAFTEAALAFWQNGFNYSGDLAALLDNTPTITQETYIQDAPAWRLFGYTSGSGATPIPVPGRWHHVEFRASQGDVGELYVDGIQSITGAMGFGVQFYNARFGSFNGGTFNVDANSQAYFANVKIGTTRGGSEIFSDDFASEDLSAWTSTSGSVSVVANPFIGNPYTTNVARVDPSGNDSTGEIGSPDLPFQTVQAALDAIQVVSPNDGYGFIVDVGANSFSEALSTPLSVVGFVGVGGAEGNANAFATLELTEDAPAGVYFDNCGGGPMTADTSFNFYMGLTGYCSVGSFTNNGSGGAIVEGSYFWNFIGDVTVTDAASSAQVRNIQWGSNITTGGGQIIFENYGNFGTLNASGGVINISNCLTPLVQDSAPPYQSALTVNSASSTVWAHHALIGDVTAAGTLHLVDSRVTGTNSASTTVCTDFWTGAPVLSAAPSSPVEGQEYSNSTDHHKYFYNGTTWKQLDN